MSNNKRAVVDPFKEAVKLLGSIEEKFTAMVASAKTDVNFKAEMLYASQAMMKNDYLATTAMRNPLGLRNAFQQLAASGLTLNPSKQLAYLVPRDGFVILDVSWRGMVKTAVLDGAIRDCIVELVYSKDKFEYRGKRQSPIHSFNPFDKKEDRGEFLGCYVEVSLPDGRVHVEVVTNEQILIAREASASWKKNKSGTWKDHEDAMRKKAAIKAASKYWPHVGQKLDEVIHYLNTEAGEGYQTDALPVEVLDSYINGKEGAAVEPLPTDNSVIEGEVVAAPAQQPVEQPTATPEPAPQAEPAAEESAPQDEAPQPPAEVAEQPCVMVEPSPEVPEKAVNQVAKIIARAQAQGAWKTAREYIDAWPHPQAREYGLKALQAAEYLSVSQGEMRY